MITLIFISRVTLDNHPLGGLVSPKSSTWCLGKNHYSTEAKFIEINCELHFKQYRPRRVGTQRKDVLYVIVFVFIRLKQKTLVLKSALLKTTNCKKGETRKTDAKGKDNYSLQFLI